jgi:hypothetical protein
MHGDDEIVAFYEAAFGPLRDPDPSWLADLVVWCRRVIEADSVQSAARTMLAWAADGDVASARESAIRLREAAAPSPAREDAIRPRDAAAPSRPRAPAPDAEQLRRWLKQTTRPGWRWWADHHLPVYIEDGSAWRRVFANGELIRAWSAAGRRICPDLSDAAVEGWSRSCHDGA